MGLVCMGAESMKLSCKRGFHLVFEAHHPSFMFLHGSNVHGCRLHERVSKKMSTIWPLTFAFSGSIGDKKKKVGLILKKEHL